MIICDCHNHIEFSHDSVCKIDDLCNSAINKGLYAIGITDHCDTGYCDIKDEKTPIINSLKAAESAKLRYNGTLNIMKGIEISEAHWNSAFSSKMLKLDYDVILGSVHAVKFKNTNKPYSLIDFSRFSDSDVNEYILSYFNEMKQMLNETDMDVLCHITCPLRYIVGRYNRKVSLSDYGDQIEEILKTAISRDLVFEINTSSVDIYDFMPSFDIIKQYVDLGGRKFSFGSDSHVAENVGNNIEQATKQLAVLGIKSAYRFENRKQIEYNF